MNPHGATHVVIPDTQVRPGTPLDHLGWIGRYIGDKFAGRRDVKIIHLGDHWDMAALSSYDKGKKAMEGRRLDQDIGAGNFAMDLLNDGIEVKWSGRRWRPERHLLRGNHEDRLTRAIEADASLDGVLTLDSLRSPGWEVHDFLVPVDLDGVAYSHYFYQPMNGRPFSGMIETRLKNIGFSFTMGHQQTLMYGVRPVGSKLHHGLVAGACLTPDHRVLTADLRYVPLGDVAAGDTLVSFDEEVAGRRARRYKTGTVRAVKEDRDFVYGVTLASGKTFKVTADHLWLTRVGGPTAVREGSSYMWRRTDALRVGTRLPQPLDEWDTLRSFGAGYLSGLFDGEGCYYTRKTSAGTIGQLSLSQKPGVVLDAAVAEMSRLVGVDGYTHTNSRGVAALCLTWGAPAVAKALGQLRPRRLLGKFSPDLLGGITTSRNDRVVDIAPIGERSIVRIDVDAGTMIVEGYPHHNCYLHDEDYKGPQGNAHYRGIIICHEVEAGSYCPMFVSLDYLCRRYEGVRLDGFAPKVIA